MFRGKRPYPISTLLMLAMLAFTVALAGLLAVVSGFAIWRSGKLQADTEAALFESIRSELEASYTAIDLILQSRRNDFREAHAEALEQVRSQWPNPDLASLQSDIRNIVGIPLDVYLINPELQVVDTTYPPDEGLDFNHPALFDGRSMIRRARREDRIVVSAPVLEAVARNFRIYTYSPIPDTEFILELGFVSPIVNNYFRESEARLGKREAFEAQLHFLMWDDWLLSLDPGRHDDLDKEALLDRHYQRQQETIEYFRQARDGNGTVRQVDEEGRPLYYLHIMDLTDEGGWEMNVMSRVRLTTDAVQNARQGMLTIVILASVIILLMGLALFFLARRHLALPLTRAAHAIENWQHVHLDEGGHPVRELQLLATHFNTMLDTARSRIQGLDREAHTDSLTGLANRAGAEAELEVEVRRGERYGHPCALVLMDLDHFKQINDRYGHLVGDDVLRLVAGTLQDRSRSADTVARWGGEEFVLICRDTTQDDAVALAEKMRSSIEETTRKAGYGCSASFGITALRDGDTSQTLFERTDRALYAAKHEGRNRVRTAD